MNQIFFFKGIQLKRILVLAAVSLLMLFSTACSRADAALKDPGAPNPPGQVQPYKGGMNNFDDVDTTRLDKAGVDAKAKALRDRVARNIKQKGIDSPEQYVENYRSGTPLNKRIENIGDDLGQSADDVKKNLQKFGERGSKNLESNVKDVPEQASRTVDQTKKNVKAAGKDISEGVKAPIDKAANALNRAGDFAESKADDTADAVRRTAN